MSHFTPEENQQIYRTEVYQHFQHREDYLAFKKSYERAVENNKEVFIFDGRDYFREYAKYLIEHMEIIHEKSKA
jgi:hypothetical protein